MDVSNLVSYDKKESLLLKATKSTLDVVENTLSKPHETIENKMNKQSESFASNTPLELPEKWMIGVIRLEVYNTLYNMTSKSNTFQIQLTDEQLSGIDIKLAMNI